MNIEAAKISGKITATVLQELKEKILQGMTHGEEIDQYAEQRIGELGAIPAFKGYRGFPASLCLSINEVVLHGVPYGKEIKKGDIVSLDLGSLYNRAYSDSAITFIYKPGIISTRKSLVRTTELCLTRAIQALQGEYPNCRLSTIACAIQSTAYGKFRIVEEFGGHGIGKQLHQDFFVPNTITKLDNDIVLQKGQMLCIEPMLCMGNNQLYKEDSGWDVRTVDRFPTAHFEHTILIGEEKVETLTEI